LVNFSALILLGVILCSAGGLIGFFVIQGLLILVVLIAPLLKCLLCKDSDHDPWGGETVSSDASFCERITNWRSVVLIVASVLLLFDIIWIVTDNIPTYQVYSRPEGAVITEYQPYLIVKSLAAVYAYKNIADKPLQVNNLFMVATQACGTDFTKTLSDSEKLTTIYTNWIAKYSVNMTLFVPSDYTQYSSVNAWFTRKINSTFRPISFPNDNTVVTSPADCRTIGFEQIGKDQEIWLKGDPFTVSQLVNSDTVYNEFPNASLIISRLSPQDYHRFHAPATGVVRRVFHINGEYQSVNSDAVSSGNEVLVKNLRTVVLLDVALSSTQNTTMLFVAIGANCVGSVQFTASVGSTITKGDDVGYFQFGGSTVVTIYQAEHLRIADDIQRDSFLGVETYVNVGDMIARFF